MQTRYADTGIEAFTAAASAYEAWFASPLGTFIDELEKQALARILQDVGGASVLEIGAGTGHMSTWLTGRGYRVLAVEPSAAMREEGRRQTDGLPIRWCGARAENLPFDAASFDGALLFTTLEFVHDPVRALQEAMRVIRLGGWVIVGFLHALSPWAALYRHRADRGEMPWAAAQWLTRADIEPWMDAPAEQSETAIHLAPQAVAPFAEAERAGKRAGNGPAIEILRWSKHP
jgi:ubiquinone/menaquinone biosynthesis C-methylase UbiE